MDPGYLDMTKKRQLNSATFPLVSHKAGPTTEKHVPWHRTVTSQGLKGPKIHDRTGGFPLGKFPRVNGTCSVHLKPSAQATRYVWTKVATKHCNNTNSQSAKISRPIYLDLTHNSLYQIITSKIFRCDPGIPVHWCLQYLNIPQRQTKGKHAPPQALSPSLHSEYRHL